MAIKMNEIKSQSIAKIGYFRRTMNVMFKNGKTYEFKKVPRVQFDNFMNSISKGRFFLDEVKGNYPVKELVM